MEKFSTHEREGATQEQREQEPQYRDLALFTTTCYGTDAVSQVREKLAEKLFENAASLGIRCVVVDGGSNTDFLERVKQLKHVALVVDPSLGMGQSRRKALALATSLPEASYYLWTEPEKDDLIKPESIQAMITGLRSNNTDIVVPRRASRETLPKFQAQIEARANKRANTLIPRQSDTNADFDLWFGPKMFNAEGAKYFLNYKGKLDKWDAILKPVVEASKDGKRITSVDVNYSYDPTQLASENTDQKMKKKRMLQYASILGELGDTFWSKKQSTDQ